MFVGVLRLVLQIPGARSLKDKRRVALSLKERLQARLRVSAAEVGNLENPRLAEIGVAVVSNEAAVCDRVLADASAMASTHPDAVLADRRVEIIPLGAGGRGISGGIESVVLSDGGTDFQPTTIGEDDDVPWDDDEESDDGEGTR
jgi:uncharacterized protein YlxP (DUF503 family)